MDNVTVKLVGADTYRYSHQKFVKDKEVGVKPGVSRVLMRTGLFEVVGAKAVSAPAAKPVQKVEVSKPLAEEEVEDKGEVDTVSKFSVKKK